MRALVPNPPLSLDVVRASASMEGNVPLIPIGEDREEFYAVGDWTVQQMHEAVSRYWGLPAEDAEPEPVLRRYLVARLHADWCSKVDVGADDEDTICGGPHCGQEFAWMGTLSEAPVPGGILVTVWGYDR